MFFLSKEFSESEPRFDKNRIWQTEPELIKLKQYPTLLESGVFCVNDGPNWEYCWEILSLTGIKCILAQKALVIMIINSIDIQIIS